MYTRMLYIKYWNRVKLDGSLLSAVDTNIAVVRFDTAAVDH